MRLSAVPIYLKAGVPLRISHGGISESAVDMEMKISVDRSSWRLSVQSVSYFANCNPSACWTKIVILSLVGERLRDRSGPWSSLIEIAREIEIAGPKPPPTLYLRAALLLSGVAGGSETYTWRKCNDPSRAAGTQAKLNY